MSENKTYLLQCKEVCRCCLDNPGSKSMWDEYLNDNEREVYGEMLSDCFGVTWEADNEELICDSCVFRLREAVKLKIEFLAVQELLKENIVLGNGKELTKYEPKAEPECESLEEECNYTQSMDYSISDLALIEVQNERRRKPAKRPYKMYTKEAMDNAIEAVRVYGKSMLEAATKFSVPRKTLALRLMTPTEEHEAKHLGGEKKLKFLKEIRTLLQNTNAVPFKTKITKRYCAFCFTNGPAFDDAIELRSHIKFYHNTNYIRNIEFMMRPWHLNEVLKVDITDLECTSCNKSIDDWNSMFVHFAEAHHKEFDDAYNKIIPFSLDGNNKKCVLCYESFTTFGNLDVHMNAHYCNYICYECGDPFLSSSRLDAHLRMHKIGKYKREMCDNVLTSQQHKIKHIESDLSGGAKDNKLVPNSMTDEKSENYTEMPCEYCGNCFRSSTSLNIHIKKMHIKKKKRSKKNYVCGVCGLEFEKFVDLKYHWREHMESIPFQKMGNVTIAKV